MDVSAPLRILMTADGRPGLWTYAMELIRALPTASILLAVMGPELTAEQRQAAARLGNCQLRFRPYAAEWMQDPWRDVARTGDWLLELEEEFTPELVHLNHYCHGSLPWTAPVLIALHGCVLSAWQAVHGEQSPRSWTRYHAEVAAGVRGANMVTASTCAMFSSFSQLYAPIPKLLHRGSVSRFPEFRKVPHGLDASRFQPSEKRDIVFCPAGAEPGALAFETLDAATRRLSWPVYTSGIGTFAALRTLSSTREASSLRAQAAIFAFPSRYEPFGFEPIKAALCGCALVLGDIPCLRETWGDAALYAPASDECKFGAALEKLTGDRVFREELGQRARQRALRMTPGGMGVSMLECYQRLKAMQTTAAEVAAL